MNGIGANGVGVTMERQMHKAAHSPGPWKKAGMGFAGIWIIAESPDPDRPFIEPDWICELHDPEKSRLDADTIEANADLIIAAPYMLDALKAAESHMSTKRHNDLMESRLYPDNHPLLQDIRRAIAMAQGEAHD